MSENLTWPEGDDSLADMPPDDAAEAHSAAARAERVMAAAAAAVARADEAAAAAEARADEADALAAALHSARVADIRARESAEREALEQAAVADAARAAALQVADAARQSYERGKAVAASLCAAIADTECETAEAVVAAVAAVRAEAASNSTLAGKAAAEAIALAEAEAAEARSALAACERLCAAGLEEREALQAQPHSTLAPPALPTLPTGRAPPLHRRSWTPLRRGGRVRRASCMPSSKAAESRSSSGKARRPSTSLPLAPTSFSLRPANTPFGERGRQSPRARSVPAPTESPRPALYFTYIWSRRRLPPPRRRPPGGAARSSRRRCAEAAPRLLLLRRRLATSGAAGRRSGGRATQLRARRRVRCEAAHTSQHSPHPPPAAPR